MWPLLCDLTAVGGPTHPVGKTVLRREYVADLVIDSGSLSAFDPVHLFDLEPFDVQVPTGKFPVFAWMLELDGPRCAGAYVAFGDVAAVDRWEPAGSKWRSPDKQSEYGVDSALGCFADNRAAYLLSGMEEDDLDLFLVSLETASTGLHGALEVPGGNGLNIVYFSSGMGDGSYPNYVGFERGSGKPACVLTDFRIVGYEVS